MSFKNEGTIMYTRGTDYFRATKPQKQCIIHTTHIKQNNYIEVQYRSYLNFKHLLQELLILSNYVTGPLV